MKILSIIISTLFLLTSSAYAQKTKPSEQGVKTSIENGITTATFKVWGNCSMCKKTIEKSLKVEGVTKANWNVDSKMISVSYQAGKITLDQIQKNIAAAGYDNVAYKGNDKAYDKLHECCQYERKK